MNDIIRYERNKLMKQKYYWITLLVVIFVQLLGLYFTIIFVNGDIDNNVIKSMYLPSLSIPAIFTAILSTNIISEDFQHKTIKNYIPGICIRSEILVSKIIFIWISLILIIFIKVLISTTIIFIMNMHLFIDKSVFFFLIKSLIVSILQTLFYSSLFIFIYLLFERIYVSIFISVFIGSVISPIVNIFIIKSNSSLFFLLPSTLNVLIENSFTYISYFIYFLSLILYIILLLYGSKYLFEKKDI